MRFPEPGPARRGARTVVDPDLVRAVEAAVGGVDVEDASRSCAGADAAAVLGAWRAWVDELPDEASTSVTLLRLRPARRLVVVVRLTGCADAEGRLGRLAVPGAPEAAVEACPWTDPAEPVHVQVSRLRALPPAAVAAVLAVAGPAADCAQDAVELRRDAGGWLLRTLSVPRLPSLDAVVHDTRRVHAALGRWATA